MAQIHVQVREQLDQIRADANDELVGCREADGRVAAVVTALLYIGDCIRAAADTISDRDGRVLTHRPGELGSLDA